MRRGLREHGLVGKSVWGTGPRIAGGGAGRKMEGNRGGDRRAGDEAFYAVVKTHKRQSNKIYKYELTMTKI